MLPPDFFNQGRMRAQHFIQAKVLTWNGRLEVKVTRVFRGDLKRGDRLSLFVSIAGDIPLKLGDPTLWADLPAVLSARYVEAFLDGDPPQVVCDQIKLLKKASWRPSGDPSTCGFTW